MPWSGSRDEWILDASSRRRSRRTALSSLVRRNSLESNSFIQLRSAAHTPLVDVRNLTVALQLGLRHIYTPLVLAITRARLAKGKTTLKVSRLSASSIAISSQHGPKPPPMQTRPILVYSSPGFTGAIETGAVEREPARDAASTRPFRFLHQM